MTQKSQARGLHPATLVLMVFSLPALLAAQGYFSLDSLWGRPLTDEVVVAAYTCALGLPGQASMIATWLVGKPPAGTPNLPKSMRLIGRALWVVMTFPILSWGLLTLVAWWQAGPMLPARVLYVCAGAFPVTFVLLLAAIAISRRRHPALWQAT